MEEILSSIKRIIAEEGDTAPARGRRPARAPVASSAPTGEADRDEVLELSDPMPAPRVEPVASPRLDPVPPRPATPEPAMPDPIVSPPLVSEGAAAASRGALDQLSRLMVKPEPGSDGSLEGLVREMLRPMLRDWLDANLPAVVETMVAREIKRITGAA